LPDPRVDAIKRGLQSAGIEVYRVRETTIEIAERVRFHIMDSGVRILVDEPLEIRFSARSQRSGNPGLDTDSLYGLVRSAISDAAVAQGFAEASVSSQDVMDPVDSGRVLDVWYEVTWAKKVGTVEEAASMVRWVLTLERFVGSSAPPDGV
jgi:hypothetical protein